MSLPSRCRQLTTASISSMSGTQDGNGHDRSTYGYRIASNALGKTIYACDLATIGVTELRALYHEVYCERQSMYGALEDMAQPKVDIDENEDYWRDESRLHKIKKKIRIYDSFYKLIKREVNWRMCNEKSNRAKVAIQAKQAGLSEDQINALLDPDNAIYRLVSISEYSVSPLKRKAISVADRMASLREQMFNARLLAILGDEFDAHELAEMRQEAADKVEIAVDWIKMEAMLTEYLPDGNGIL